MIESEIDRGIFVSRVEAERTAFHQLIDRYVSETAPKHKGTIRGYRPSSNRAPANDEERPAQNRPAFTYGYSVAEGFTALATD